MNKPCRETGLIFLFASEQKKYQGLIKVQLQFLENGIKKEAEFSLSNIVLIKVVILIFRGI
ncbi:hypothetical protein HMPREF2531_03075 [Bacteroides intestinalis]|uniref:Uncharacterized protein n=1 Tax=Bacteroides intestinalis TaxID=329854 RepID=A0A139L7H6_9BACE|nr:hypothetical protein HMPREF2531_03075 [Bacteroides intestinalis]